MKISHYWLQKFFDIELPSAEKLQEALTFHVFEVESLQKVLGDHVLEVKITPNRGHDCLSHRGIAKEISAILNIPLIHDPFAHEPRLEPVTDVISVSIHTDTCSRYIAGYIKGVKVGPSSQWLKERLEAIGQRSINNVVDAMNFVMFNTGQPLHAFDAGKLIQKNGKYAIAVRSARSGEQMQALDGMKYELTSSMLIIADQNDDEPIGVAGIKGGMPAAITEATKNIIIESANFDGASVRRTAAALKLRTDASTRFEQVISPELAAYGIQAAVDMIVQLAGGEIVGFVDVYPHPKKYAPVTISLAETNKILGGELSQDAVAGVFTRLGFLFTENHQTFAVTVPFERLDISLPEDLTEEIARIVGYEKIPTVNLPPSGKTPEINKNFYWSERIREFLISRGFSEIYTSLFTAQGVRAVLNKVESSTPYLRQSLLPAMQEALRKNERNKELLGLDGVLLFEIGAVFPQNEEKIFLAIGALPGKSFKKTAPDILKELSITLSLPLPEATGGEESVEIDLENLIISSPTPTLYEHFPLSSDKQYHPFSKYPYIVRDIALWVSQESEEEEVRTLISAEAGSLLVRLDVFDRFEKEGKVSLAFRLIFQSFERTLTEVEVHTVMEKIAAALYKRGLVVR